MKWQAASLALVTLANSCAMERRPVPPFSGALPPVVRFEENLGQFPDAVSFLTRQPGYTAYLAAAEAGVRLRLLTLSRQSSFAVSLAGASRSRPRAEGVLPSYSNYFTGGDPTRWRTGVRHFARVRFRDV
jgi:hypothetical protein